MSTNNEVTMTNTRMGREAIWRERNTSRAEITVDSDKKVIVIGRFDGLKVFSDCCDVTLWEAQM